MKNFPNKTLATASLFTAGIIGGIVPILSKLLFRELSPLSVLFFSITIMLGVLIPLDRTCIGELKKHWRRLVIFGFLWTGNVTLFILGVKHTTAVASQALYASVPLLVLVEQYIAHGERIVPWQIVGIFLGFAGVLVLVIGSLGGGTDLGSFTGNFLIFLGTFSWASYLVLSKLFSVHVRPMTLTTASAIIGWGISLVVLLAVEGVSGLTGILSLSFMGWMLLLCMGLVVRIGMILLYNWGIKYGSSIAAGSMVYVSTITSAIIAPIILGEQLTFRMAIAAALLFAGVYLTTTSPMLFLRGSKK